MKKAFYLLIAAATLMTVASCVKDQFESIRPESSVGQTEFTVSLAPGTRTDLNEEGKTVWTEGDTLWVTNGVGVDKIGVSEEAWGTQEFSIKTDKATPTVDNPTVYIVYPYDSGSKITEDGKVVVKVPGVQDGTFASANICAGVSEGQSVALRNVTAVMKVTVPAETPAPIYQLVFTAAGEGAALSGDVAVDFSGENPVITAENTSASVVTNVGGVDGEIYTAVIPGKYEAGFKLTAATIDFEHATQTKATTAANDVKINEIVDLGSIGTDLQPLAGNGSKGNPFQIENLAHLIALSAAVDNNYEDVKGFEGQYFKVMNDISGVTTPIGTGEYPFCGDFDGNNQSIKVDISGNSDGMGLFAYISNGACIHDLVVEGSVTSSGDFIGGVIGYSVCDKDGARATVKNVVNTAKVKGDSKVGGIAGYTNYTDFDGCINTGTVDGVNSLGGILGYAYYSSIVASSNTGAVTSSATSGTGMYIPATGKVSNANYPNGTGGIVGWAQNSSLKDLTNTADVTAFNKVGGIAGVTYWTPSEGLVNSGTVIGTGYLDSNVSSQNGLAFGSAAGGVIGWAHINGNVKDCVNSGDVYGKTGVGGVVGFATGYYNNANVPKFENLINSGDVYADTEGTGLSFPRGIQGQNAGTGGIIGSYVRFGTKHAASVKGCINKGDVFATTVNTGGIVGLMYDHANGSKPLYSYIQECINEGDVTGGPYWVGGIVGYSFARYTGRLDIRNCENHGKITGTRPSGNGTVAGGIIGGFGANVATYQGTDMLHLYNNYNDGEVVYSSLSLTVPYVGGIIGNSWGNAAIQNNYNVGYVGPFDHSTPVEAALNYLGGLAGYQKNSSVHYCYSSDAVLNGQLVGKAGAANRTDTVCTFNEEGTLSTVVVANGQDCTTLIDALNGWQDYYVGDGTVYYNWTGPAGHPVFDSTMN